MFIYDAVNQPQWANNQLRRQSLSDSTSSSADQSSNLQLTEEHQAPVLLSEQWPNILLSIARTDSTNEERWARTIPTSAELSRVEPYEPYEALEGSGDWLLRRWGFGGTVQHWWGASPAFSDWWSVELSSADQGSNRFGFLSTSHLMYTATLEQYGFTYFLVRLIR